MKVLFLSNTLPHSRVVSGAVNVHRRIRHLAEHGHTVGLASFLHPSDEPYRAEMQAAVSELETLPPPRLSWSRCAAGYLTARRPPPFCAEFSPEMLRLVGRMVARSRYEIAVAEFSVMGQYLYRNPFLPAVRRVISCHSCITTAMEKTIQLQPRAPASLLRGLLCRRLEAYEFAMYRSADLVLTLTSEEQSALLHHAPSLRIAVVPYGVDANYYRPGAPAGAEESIVCTGYYSQEPNRDAVHWFVKTVWPELSLRRPNLRFYIVGQGAGPDLLALSRHDPRIVVTGAVDDVLPYLARARVYVCPMRLGTGFRGKILQAMAAGVPVVATSLSAEGIPAHTGDSIVLADTPHTMLEALTLLLEDAPLRQRIAERARQLVEQRFAWERCVELVEKALLSVLQ